MARTQDSSNCLNDFIATLLFQEVSVSDHLSILVNGKLFYLNDIVTFWVYTARHTYFFLTKCHLQQSALADPIIFQIFGVRHLRSLAQPQTHGNNCVGRTLLHIFTCVGSMVLTIYFFIDQMALSG